MRKFGGGKVLRMSTFLDQVGDRSFSPQTQGWIAKTFNVTFPIHLGLRGFVHCLDAIRLFVSDQQMPSYIFVPSWMFAGPICIIVQAFHSVDFSDIGTDISCHGELDSCRANPY